MASRQGPGLPEEEVLELKVLGPSPGLSRGPPRRELKDRGDPQNWCDDEETRPHWCIGFGHASAGEQHLGAQGSCINSALSESIAFLVVILIGSSSLSFNS